eukprot:TRINITY_DN21670_c0_g1_i1.p1 TRINITY_DN21670_c0_g1~~TRINITY_DN21670_c0_g1_i1.p1  ORF type:complete len:388 (+),score=107.50 TRINITY_DN21670_c0_g1_i1:25-1188(+)
MNRLSYNVLPVYLLKLDIVKTKKLSFESTFTVDEGTTKEFQKISEFREELILANERQYAEAATNGVKNYLPCLFGLIKAVEKLPTHFCKYLRISWTSSLSDKFQNTFKTHYDWNFEVINVLFTYGLLLRKRAIERLSNINETDFINECQDPIRLLRESAGVFQHIINYFSKFVPNIDEYPIPEMVSDTYLILADISLAESQTLILKSAIMGKKNGNIISKLCAGVAQLYEHAHKTFEESLKNKPKQYSFHPSIKTYLHLSKNLYNSFSYQFMGMHYFQTGEAGKSVAYLKRAESILKTTTFTPNPKIAMDAEIQIFWNKFVGERELVGILSKEFEVENREIYHEIVLDQEKVVFPEAKVLTTPINFEPPEALPINIIPTTSWYCTII